MKKNVTLILFLLASYVGFAQDYGAYCDTCVFQLSRDSLNRPAQQGNKVITPLIHKATMLMANKKMEQLANQNKPTVTQSASTPTLAPQYAKMNYDSVAMVLTGYKAGVGWVKIAGPRVKEWKYQESGNTVTFTKIITADAEIALNGVILRPNTHYLQLNDYTIQMLDPPIRQSWFLLTY